MPCGLISGGSGFFGGVLIDHLLQQGWDCINIDILDNDRSHKNLTNIKGDIRSLNDINKCFKGNKIDVVFHCAALLAHGNIKKEDLNKTNIDGTKNLAEISLINKVNKFIYISSNCLWGKPIAHKINEHEYPLPCEDYGFSKLGGEIVLNSYNELNPIIFRVPTLIDEGRLGLLGILFDFISNNKRVWVVGNGNNKYQFLYAKDLADACILSTNYKGSGIFNLGTDNVKTLKQVYQYVIKEGGSTSKISKLPRRITLLAMQLFYSLGLSPLGPYHRRMIAESFMFDTSKAKSVLCWEPTLSNEEILLKAYKYYIDNKGEILDRKNVSAHNSVAKAGIINLLKLIS